MMRFTAVRRFSQLCFLLAAQTEDAQTELRHVPSDLQILQILSRL
jgi:hypothetical protein